MENFRSQGKYHVLSKSFRDIFINYFINKRKYILLNIHQFIGHAIPEHLDPLSRKRGKQGLIEDGPVTVMNGSFDPRAIKISDITFDYNTKSENKNVSIARDTSHTNHPLYSTNTTPLKVVQTQAIEVYVFLLIAKVKYL